MELALSTVAQWAGSAIIKKLVETGYSHLGKSMLPVDTEFKAQLSRLETALPQIEAVMGVAEMLKFKYPNKGVDKWLEKFKEGFLAAEDVLDELKYRELEHEVKNRDQVSGSSSSTVKKKIYSLKKKFSGSSNSKDILKRLRGAVEKLDMVAAGVGHFFQFTNVLDFHGLANPNNQPVNTSSRETTSFLTESKVFGRENEKAMIIEWLKKPASHGNISAFCIVGVGGLGKTTLAQLIFEEISKEQHFDQIIWVCVSTIFNAEDIIRKILQELGENCCHNESLNLLQLKLREKIFSKKILFILDDVWNDDKMCEWEKLIPLKFSQQGSKILLTTRIKLVADMLGRVLNVGHEYKVLEGLEKQQLLLLLNKYAFHNYNPDNYKYLQNIGNDIVKKLWGSPLAAKVIGSLLNSNMDSHYWKTILNHDSLINLEQAQGVADVLKLSYYHLPVNLQECFRFCCIFPQDYKFNKYELIKMWMASGFIHQKLNGGARPEDIGEEYFNQLYRKSFFEKWFGFERFYVMHDLIHDLAQNVSEGECCRVEQNGKSDIIPCSAQHVSIHESKIERIFNLRNLRTLVITFSDDHINRDRFVLPNGSLKKTLRLLVIQGYCRCELPDEIGSLLHLRFLKVDLGYMEQSYRYLLPNSIYKLYHLQVLEMSRMHGNSDYEAVATTGMTNFVSLRYMDLPNRVMEKIHGVHKLTSIQNLDFFVGRESGHHIDELEMLNNLRHLSIKKIENIGGPVEATNVNLSKKESLIRLLLNWTKGANSDNPEEVIDNLRPNSNLKDLIIEYYTGCKSPIWMRDTSHLYLLSLTLEGCPLWEALPFLGQMPYLKQLALIGMDEVKEVDYSCDSTSDCAFPALEVLYCKNMPKWESWTGPHICYGFPILKQLTIYNCPNLAKLPAIPSTLFKFEVSDVGLNSLPDMYHGSSITAPAPSCMKSSLRTVVISNCPKLISLNGFLQQQTLDLQAVEGLTIKGCKNLLQLPTEGFGKLTALKYLTIENNPELATVDFRNKLIPVKLQQLIIKNCGELGVALLGELFGHTNQGNNLAFLQGLKELHIENCDNLVQLPTGTFEKFVSLESLSIMGCPKLVTVDNRSIILPVKLRYLEIGNCGKLDVPLLEAAWQHSTLHSLEIRNSSNITCIPSSENATSLFRLGIHGCNKLIELSSMQQAHTVNPGNNLVSLKISYVYIDDLCLLLIEPLRCLRFVRSLWVEKCSGMETLPEQWLLQNSSTLESLIILDGSSLRSLPGTMVMLTALESLLINKAPLLEEIPELPTSLISFYRDEKRVSLGKAL